MRLLFLFFVFRFLLLKHLFDSNVIFVYSWGTFYFIYFMSNIIREMFVEDHVRQVSTSIKATLHDLLRHARDFKFIYRKHNGL